MPAFRRDLASIATYVPGKPIEDVMRDFGVTEAVMLASNECPQEPFAPVQVAIAAAAAESHRYPDTSAHRLTAALAGHYHVAPDAVWVGPGSTSILTSIALAMGGSGTSAVFSDQSFVFYGIATAMAGAAPIVVRVDGQMRLDPAAMAAAVRADTTVLYVCNPNNPTGTYLPPAAVAGLIDATPNEVLVVIDEAYEEYVTHAGHVSAIPLALTHANVVVTRTFSKVYGIAGLRVGYAMGVADTIGALRRLQLPFATSNVGLVAAEEALRHQDLVAARVKENARGREQISAGLAALGVACLDSQTNFVLMSPPGDVAALCDELLRRGIIVRRFGQYVRVTIGTEAENARFMETLGGLL